MAQTPTMYDGYFNSRDPYGPRSVQRYIFLHSVIFQFTRPIRAAIQLLFQRSVFRRFQFTRPIRAAILPVWSPERFSCISIHATHTGRDASSRAAFLSERNFNSRDPYGPRCPVSARPHPLAVHFNSRDPYGPRSLQPLSGATIEHISIHATHTGRDEQRATRYYEIHRFQFTRPIRAAIGAQKQLRRRFGISIHATHTGRDYMERIMTM